LEFVVVLLQADDSGRGGAEQSQLLWSAGEEERPKRKKNKYVTG